MCALFKIARFRFFFILHFFPAAGQWWSFSFSSKSILTFVGGATSSGGGEWLELFSSPFDSEFSSSSLMTGRSSRISVASKAAVFLSALLSYCCKIGCSCVVSRSCRNHQRGRSSRSAFLLRSGFLAFGIGNVTWNFWFNLFYSWFGRVRVKNFLLLVVNGTSAGS